MPNDAMNPNMDIDYILASYKDDEPETQTEPGASEPAPETQTATAGDGGHPEQAAGAEPAKQEPAKADGPLDNAANAPAGQQAAGAEPKKNDGEPVKGEGGVAGTEGNAGAASEPAKAKPKVPRRNPLSRLEKAEYSTRKWKQKYRDMREKRDALQAELEKYSRIDPAQFSDPAARERFISWQARAEQKLNGMDEDLEDIARQTYEREYESKVDAFYPDEDSRRSFEALDEHYGNVLDATCQRLDPDNIILDYLQNSPYEPVMRNVIYKNGPLQEELFKRFGSRAIANAERVQILRQLEGQIKAFYARERGEQPEHVTAQQAGSTAGAPQQRRFSLPPRKDAAPATATAQPAATQTTAPAGDTPAPAPASAPAPAPAQPPMSSGVTGSLTRGNEGGGTVDERAEANALYKKLFGS